MAQVTETVARGILAGHGYTDNEVRQLAHHWLASHGEAPASVLHLVHSAFAEIAMAFPKAFAMHKVGIADTAVLKALAAPATAQAAEPVALLVRKNSWRDGQWEAAPPNSPSYGLAWADQRVYVYTTPPQAPATADSVQEALPPNT